MGDGAAAPRLLSYVDADTRHDLAAAPALTSTWDLRSAAVMRVTRADFVAALSVRDPARAA